MKIKIGEPFRVEKGVKAMIQDWTLTFMLGPLKFPIRIDHVTGEARAQLPLTGSFSLGSLDHKELDEFRQLHDQGWIEGDEE